MEKRFLYRADMEYETGKGIKRELENDEDYEKSITTYIMIGSTWDNDEQPFISLTENAGVATWYALSIGFENQFEMPRKPVLLVDMKAVEEKTGLKGIDLRNEEDYKRAKKKSELDKQTLLDSGYNNVRASHEIIIQTTKDNHQIPEECIREIPSYLVDILQSFDFAKRRTNSERAENLEEKIQEMIFDEEKYNLLKNVIEKIELTEFQKDFVRLFYIEKKPIQTIIEFYKEKEIDLDIGKFGCVRTQLVNEILASSQFREAITAGLNKDEIEQFDKTVKKVNEGYSGIIEKISTHAPETEINQENWEHDNYPLGDSLCIKGEMSYLPKKYYTIEDIRQNGGKRLSELDGKFSINEKLIIPEGTEEMENYGAPIGFSYITLEREEKNGQSKIEQKREVTLEENEYNEKRKICAQSLKKSTQNRSTKSEFTKEQLYSILQEFSKVGQSTRLYKKGKNKDTVGKGVISKADFQENEDEISYIIDIVKNKRNMDEQEVLENIEIFTPKKKGHTEADKMAELFKKDISDTDITRAFCKIKYGERPIFRIIEKRDQLKKFIQDYLLPQQKNLGKKLGSAKIEQVTPEEQDIVQSIFSKVFENEKGELDEK